VPLEAAHVRTATDGGVGMKPTDRYAVVGRPKETSKNKLNNLDDSVTLGTWRTPG